MVKIRSRIFGILLCVALLFSIIPAQATASAEIYVSMEEAVAGLLDTIGLDALNDTQSDLSVFSDADQISSQYADVIAIAVTNGILPIVPGEELNPRMSITRLEFALLVGNSMRELPAIKEAPVFADVPAEGVEELNRITAAGLMSVYGNGYFGSGDYLTKEQLGIVLNKIRSLLQ